jgi:hypothetical protein
MFVGLYRRSVLPGDWRRLHNEELRTLQFSPNVIIRCKPSSHQDDYKTNFRLILSVSKNEKYLIFDVFIRKAALLFIRAWTSHHIGLQLEVQLYTFWTLTLHRDERYYCRCGRLVTSGWSRFWRPDLVGSRQSTLVRIVITHFASETVVPFESPCVSFKN